MAQARWDLIVVGAGPGGATAAKVAAERGLTTLLLEAHPLPRDKVCTGMIMAVGTPAIAEIFGPIPPAVLTDPPHFDAYAVRAPGAGERHVVRRIGNAWRRDLDRWMAEEAVASGATLWDGTRATAMEPDTSGFRVTVQRAGEPTTLVTRYLVGADGASSTMRKALFPEVPVRYAQGYQAWYRAPIALPRPTVNLFTWPAIAPLFCDVTFKGDIYVVEAGARSGDMPVTLETFAGHLCTEHGWEANAALVWKSACAEPLLYGDLFSGRFVPARGNALLIGDAAGLMYPVTAEGIGPAIRSGLWAAEAIAASAARGGTPDGPYMAALADTIRALRAAYGQMKEVLAARERGPEALLDTFAHAWETVLDLSC